MSHIPPIHIQKNSVPYSLTKYLLGAAVTLLLLSAISLVGRAAVPNAVVTGIEGTHSTSSLSLVFQNTTIEVVTAVTLSSSAPIAGEAVTGTFAIKNVGSQPVQMANLLITGRGDGCVDWSCTNYQNFTAIKDITIASGETYTYSQPKTFTDPGDYFAQIAYQLPNDSWVFLDDRVNFAISAQLILDVPLTFTSASPVTGELLTATFTVRNAGAERVEFLNIGVGFRGPDCADWASCTTSSDMPFDATISLNPGESFTYSQQKAYWDSGSYLGRILFKTADGWSSVGETQTIVITPGLVVTTPLSMVPGDLHTNEFVTVSFTVQNQSNRVLTYSRLGVSGRGPNCPPLDWGCESYVEISYVDAVSINPGEVWQYNGRHFFPESGNYYFQIWVKQTNDDWHRLDNPVSITVAPTNYPARSQALKVGAHLHATLDPAEDARLLTEARDMGIDIIRMTLLWRFLEKDFKGDYDENWYIPAVRQTIEKANELGIEVYIIFFEAPCWASSDPNKDCSGDDGGTYDFSYPAQNHQDYADAYQKVVQEFGDKVDTWEVWNEPNIERFWHPSQSIATYTNMLKVTYPAIKSVDPNTTVLAGVIAGSSVPVLEEMYAAGAKGNFDAFSIHPYSDAPTDCTNHDWSFLCGVEIIRATMLEHDDPKPIWFSEFGWSSYVGPSGFGETNQRDYLAESIDIMGNWDYVPVATWYTLYDRTLSFPETPYEEHFGLLNQDLQDKPAATWLRSRPKPDAELSTVTPLAFSSSSPMQGESITASFTIQNNGSQPIPLSKIGVIVRNAACEPHLVCSSYQDFPLDENITIAAGETYSYQQQYTSTQSGEHFAQVVYESSIGEWFMVGTKDTVTIRVNPSITATPVPATVATPTPTSTTVAPTGTPTLVSTNTPTPVPNVTPSPTVSSGTSTVPPTAQPLLDLFLPMLVK